MLNGCSYEESYARGVRELAKSLGIKKCYSLALGGSANSRILRTTLKHSYKFPEPTFYLIGLTFASRWELPIFEAPAAKDFEGRWINPQAQRKSTDKFQFNWTDKDTETFTELNFKSVIFSESDQLEDLMYRCLSLIGDLNKRGHRVLIYNNCNKNFGELVDNDSTFSFIKDNPVFVDGLRWTAIPWQHLQGARAREYPSNVELPPLEFQHIHGQDYKFKNQYLFDYIQQHKILE